MNNINFYDYCTTQETMHKAYSTMLNPFATNAPQDYADFFNNAEKENLVLHKLNCIICALKQSGNSYAQNIDYFTKYDIENTERDFVRKLRIEL